MKSTNTFTSFSIPDPITCNRFLTMQNTCQNFCTKNSTPHIFARLIVGVLIKDVTRVCAIVINVFAALGKLAFCAAQVCYAIPARLWSSFPNYKKTGKEALVYLGFSGFYLADLFISFRNISHTYPEDLLEKIEGKFAGFLYSKDPYFLALLASGMALKKSWILADNANKVFLYSQNKPSFTNSHNKYFRERP